MARWRWLDQITDHEQLLRLKLLGTVPLFAGLTRRQLGKLLVKFFEKEYLPGETIFMEGSPESVVHYPCRHGIDLPRPQQGKNYSQH
jgi:hypothetical protein